MTSKKTVLLVEDDPDLLDFAGDFLNKLGYQVLKAEDASAALSVLDKEQLELDLVFSDIRLPGELNGIELVERALNLRPDLKILLASGYDSHFLENQIGHFPFIEKPYYPDKLKQAIQTLIGVAREEV